jgi:2-dehydro-3-deoxy-D-arabinonate dehydratase
MILTRLLTPSGPRWAVDGALLLEDFRLGALLALPASQQAAFLARQVTSAPAEGAPLAPIEDSQEVWASGVTYLRSRDAREAESSSGDIYQRVYDAERPELFFKACGWRVVAPGAPVRVRADSRWNVPEPELALVLNRHGEICAYTAGNDVSSRDIEGENPLYLPQAKVYTGACALGPALHLVADPAALSDLPIQLEIWRGGAPAFRGETRTSLMKRSLDTLAAYLFRALEFPEGAFLLTGTGIVPPDNFSLAFCDECRITVGECELRNPTA